MRKTILWLATCAVPVLFSILIGSCGPGIIQVGDDEFDDAWYPVRSFTSLGQVDNLAPDPGFESNPSTDYSTTGNALFLWSGKERTGHHAIRIKSRTAGGLVALWFSKPERIPVAPGGNYDSSGWMIGRRVDQYGALGMVFYDSGLNRLQDFESGVQVRGTTDWQQLAVSATAPSGAAFLSVEFRLYGKGDIYLDDLLILGANDCVPDCRNVECGLDPVCLTQNCGDCPPPKTCGGGGAPNVCGCTPETDGAFCARLGKSCGTAAGTDNCGASRSASCGECPASCGNGKCEAGEDCASCAADCGGCPVSCGNGNCDAGEDCASCAGDCGACPAKCGNRNCEAGEDCTSCSADCGACPAVCGNGNCEAEEDCTSCLADCGACTSCTPESDVDFCARMEHHIQSSPGDRLDNCGQLRSTPCKWITVDSSPNGADTYVMYGDDRGKYLGRTPFVYDKTLNGGWTTMRMLKPGYYEGGGSVYSTMNSTYTVMFLSPL